MTQLIAACVALGLVSGIAIAILTPAHQILNHRLETLELTE